MDPNCIDIGPYSPNASYLRFKKFSFSVLEERDGRIQSKFSTNNFEKVKLDFSRLSNVPEWRNLTL